MKSFRDGLAIRERLAKADPGNAGWQRDLSVSYDRVGDVQVAQGNLADALKIVPRRAAIVEGLAKADPATPGGSATSPCPTASPATCWSRRDLTDA